MFDAIFLILYISYILLGIKVEQWTALSTLAVKSATPNVFAKYPEVFLIANTVLLLASFIASFYTIYIPKFISLPLVPLTFLCVVTIGRKLAYKEFNEFTESSVSYQEFHTRLIENKRVIKKRFFKDGRPIK